MTPTPTYPPMKRPRGNRPRNRISAPSPEMTRWELIRNRLLGSSLSGSAVRPCDSERTWTRCGGWTVLTRPYQKKSPLANIYPQDLCQLGPSSRSIFLQPLSSTTLPDYPLLSSLPQSVWPVRNKLAFFEHVSIRLSTTEHTDAAVFRHNRAPFGSRR